MHPFFIRPPSPTEILNAPRKRVDELMRSRGWDWPDLYERYKCEHARHANVYPEGQLKRLEYKAFCRTFRPGYGPPTESVRDSDRFLLAMALNVSTARLVPNLTTPPPLSRHQPSSPDAGEGWRYTNALIQAGRDIKSKNPRTPYYVAGAFPTFAVSSPPVVRRIYADWFRGDSQAVEQFVTIAGYIRRQYQVDLPRENLKPAITNYVCQASFADLCAGTPPDEVGVMDDFLCDLRRLVGDRDERYRLVLVTGGQLAGIDTRLIAAGRVASERVRGRPFAEWTSNSRQFTSASVWFDQFAALVGKDDWSLAQRAQAFIDEQRRVLEQRAKVRQDGPSRTPAPRRQARLRRPAT